MFSRTSKCAAIGSMIFFMAQGGRSLNAQSAAPLRLEKATKLALDLDTHVNSGTTREGEPVLFRARNDIKVQGAIAIPQRTPIIGTVIGVSPAFVNGKPQKAEVHIRLDGISLNDGSVLALKARELILKAETAGRSTNGTVLQGSAGPALMGGMMGGLIGGSARASGIGAVAAIGVHAIEASRQPRMRGSDVDLPRDGIFETQLELPLDIANPALLAATPIPAMPRPLPFAAPVRTPSDASLPVRRSLDSTSPAALLRGDERSPLPASLPITNESVPAPGAATGAFTMTLDVNRVLVDAVVRDRGGNPMTNLRKEDFRLLVDGVEQEIRDFSRDELPLAVALVIDRSGSVAPFMNRIQNAAFQALQQLKDEDEVCLITFAADVDLLEGLTADRDRVASRIGAIRAGGGTAIVDAMDEAFRYLAQAAPDRRRAVILISDNIEGHSRTNLSDTMRLASETNAVVYSVKIGQAPVTRQPGLPLPGIPLPSVQAPTPLFDPVPIIAKETGGEVFTTSVNALDAALATAIARLKLRYTLSYAPGDNSAGRYHTFKVQLADRFGKSGFDYMVHSRNGYFGGAVQSSGKAAR